MKINKLTICLFALILAGAGNAELINLEGKWYPKGRGSGYIRKVEIPRGGFDFSDPNSALAKGKATFIGSCLSCSSRSVSINGTVDTGIAFSTITKGDLGEYIEMTMEGENMKLKYKVTRRPRVCRLPYNCVWEVEKRETLFFVKGN